MNEHSVMIGKWPVRFSDETVFLPSWQRDYIERTLNNFWLPLAQKEYSHYPLNFPMKRWGVPSIIVRVDMPPIADWGVQDPVGIYEVEAGPAGLGVTIAAGVPVGTVVALALKQLGITQIESAVAPSRVDQGADFRILIDALEVGGIGVVPVDLKNSTQSGLPLLARGGEEELGAALPRSLFMHSDDGGTKGYLQELMGARFLDQCEDPFREFPSGFVVKPKHGWGSFEVNICTPLRPWKRGGVKQQRMKKLLAEIKEADRECEYLVQPFLSPQPIGDSFRIWRVFAVFTERDGYRVIGGSWNQSPSLIVHGRSDTLTGPILSKQIRRLG